MFAPRPQLLNFMDPRIQSSEALSSSLRFPKGLEESIDSAVNTVNKSSLLNPARCLSAAKRLQATPPPPPTSPGGAGNGNNGTSTTTGFASSPLSRESSTDTLNRLGGGPSGLLDHPSSPAIQIPESRDGFFDYRDERALRSVRML